MRTLFLFLTLSCGLHAQDPESLYQQARGRVRAISAERLETGALTPADQASLAKANEELEKALRARLDFVDARVELGRVQSLRREFEGAIESATEALRKDPKNLGAELVRADALIRMGKAGVGRLFMEDALKEHPDNPDVLYLIGAAYRQDGRNAEAEEAFAKVWKVEPTNVRGLRGMLRSLVARQEKAKALELVQAEAARMPERRDVRNLLGQIAREAGKYDLAVEAFQFVVTGSEKPSAVDLFRLGDAYRAKGDLDLAIDYFRKASVEAEDPAIPLNLAMALDASGKKKEAEQAYRQVVAIDTRNPIALNNLAWYLADNGGDLKEALDLAQRAREGLPTNPEIIDTIGWIYLKSNKFTEAADLFDQVTARNSSNPSFRYHLALALSLAGNKERALREAKRAIEDKPAKDDLAKLNELIGKLEGAK
jgi:tetratricopeptide (TPR) repeat protein